MMNPNRRFHTSNNFPDGAANNLCISGCSDNNCPPEDCWIDPFPLIHANNLSFRDKEFDLGSFLDYVPPSIFDSTPAKAYNQQNRLQRPIIEDGVTFGTDNSRPPSIKRSGACEAAPTNGAAAAPKVPFPPPLFSDLPNQDNTLKGPMIAAGDTFETDSLRPYKKESSIGDTVATGGSVNPMKPCSCPSPFLFDSPVKKSNQENILKRPIIIEDGDTFETDCRPPSIKRGRACKDVATDNAVARKVKEELPRFRGYQETQWHKQFQALQEFKERYGHCCVPNRCNENPVLGRWVKRQRYQHKLFIQGQKTTLTPSRFKALDDAGFIWDSHCALWEERVNQLKDYSRTHGHCNVPSTYSHNPQLSTWVKCQRRQYRLYLDGNASSNLTKERISALDSLGFQWHGRLIRSSSRRPP